MQKAFERRKWHLPDSAGLDWAMPPGASHTALGIQAVACKVFEEGAGYVPEDHLIAWQGDPEVLVDRFDGRLLLESLKRWQESSCPPTEAEHFSAEELEAERYADLDYSREERLAAPGGWFQAEAHGESEEDDSLEQIVAQNGDTFSAVGFDYDQSAEETARPRSLDADKAAVDSAPYMPPSNIPDGLLVPTTQREHQIIARTASFVRGAGQQSVFVLRVKHSGNPNFAFLMPDARLYPYFQWLCNNEQELIKEAMGQPHDGNQARDGAHRGTALSLLGSYGSEDSDSPKVASAPRTDLPRLGSVNEAAASTSSVQEGPLPPAEIQAVIGKLVKFVQKGGKKFEASVRKREKGNARFAFLDPSHQYHWFYRDKLRGMYRKEMAARLGEAAASAILPAAEVYPSQLARTAPAALEASSGTASVHQNQPQAAETEVLQRSGIRANPSMVKVAFRPLLEPKVDLPEASGSSSKEVKVKGDAEGVVSAGRQAKRVLPKESSLKPELKNAGSGDGTVDKGVVSVQVVESNEGFLAATQGPGHVREKLEPDSAQPQMTHRMEEAHRKESVATEDKKAQRRRLARELLMQKQVQQEQAAREKQRLTENILHHRTALLAEEAGTAEQASQPPVAMQNLAMLAPIERKATAAAQLPKLDELLKLKRAQPADRLSDFEVLGPVDLPAAGRSTSGNKYRRNGADKRRRRSQTPPSTGSSASSDCERLAQRSSKKANRRRSRSPRMHKRRLKLTSTSNPDPADRDFHRQSPEMTERIRALLRAQQ